MEVKEFELKKKYLNSLLTNIKKDSENFEALSGIIDTISKYNFDYEDTVSSYTNRIQDELGLENLEQGYIFVREYIKFISLFVLQKKKAKNDKPLTNGCFPTFPISIAWRNHALFTKKYQEFCKLLGVEWIEIDLNEIFAINYARSRDYYEQREQSYLKLIKNLKDNFHEFKSEVWPSDFRLVIKEFIFSSYLNGRRFVLKKDLFNHNSIPLKPQPVPEQGSNEFYHGLLAQFDKQAKKLEGFSFLDVLEMKIDDTYYDESFQTLIMTRFSENETLHSKFKYCFEFQMPENFSIQFCKENLVSPSLYQGYLKNYRIYLFLKVFKPEGYFSPSEEVDIVWHMHQNFSEHYKLVTMNLFGFVLNHNPSKGGKNEVENHQGYYEKSIETIREIFMFEPENYFWPGASEMLDYYKKFRWYYFTEFKRKGKKTSFIFVMNITVMILCFMLVWILRNINSIASEEKYIDTAGD